MDGKSKHSLLIVDDESSNLKVLSYILGKEYTIYTATNGVSAIEKAKEYKPDLILLDIVMPDMDGYQTLTSLKKCDDLKKIPVVFITGLDSDEDEEKGLSLEAADYITKPFKAQIVKLRVRNQIMLKSAVRTAEKANKSKSVFLAKMSHEIRTPLNAVLNISAINLENSRYPVEAKEAFNMIHNSGGLLLEIINGIHDMLKIEDGKLELVPVQYNTAQFIRDTILLNVIKYENKPIEFSLDVDENIPSELFGDDCRIKQFLNNLLSNAFKYTVSGDVELSVSLEKTDDEGTVMLNFSVRDTGQGMTSEQVEKLMLEYKNFSGEASFTNESAGVGMNILMELIHLMKGDLKIKSKQGYGSTFTVLLPQGDVGSPALGMAAVDKLKTLCLNYRSNAGKSNVERQPIPPGKVLVVDDVDINLYVVKEMLSFYGLEIDLAACGDEAVEKAKKDKYDLIFMDYIMPGMDGIETTIKLRKLGGHYGNVPIIALTANAVSGVKEMFLTNGSNDFMTKPVDMYELDRMLKKWMPQGGDKANAAE